MQVLLFPKTLNRHKPTLFVVHPSIRVAPTDEFSWHWYWGFLWKLREIPDFVEVGHFAWTRKYVLLFPATLNRHNSDLRVTWYQACYDSHGGTNITRTCHIVMLYVDCLSCFIQLLKYNPSSCSDSGLSTVPNHIKYEINVATRLRSLETDWWSEIKIIC